MNEVMEGHDSKGRFTAGNKCARGNPYARKAAEYRRAVFSAVSAADVRAVVRKLKEQALEGDMKAIALFLERVLGSVKDFGGVDIMARIEALEEMDDGDCAGEA